MRHVEMRGGLSVPVLGQGTWRMGEDRAKAADEAAALRAGIEAGITLIDTAEMYGDGATETFIGHVFAGCRDDLFLVSKVYPRNASLKRMPMACENSLKRLKTDRLDLYLLHWPGSVPLAETVEAMERLVAAGKIRAWGVSNFDDDAMEALVEAGGGACATNQVLYNVTRRGPDFDLAPWLRRHGMPLMAYSPFEQGRLPDGGALARVAESHGTTPMAVALAWAIRDGAFAIPKAGTVAHVRENAGAADLRLTAEDLATLDKAFPPPTRRQHLAML